MITFEFKPLLFWWLHHLKSICLHHLFDFHLFVFQRRFRRLRLTLHAGDNENKEPKTLDTVSLIFLLVKLHDLPCWALLVNLAWQLYLDRLTLSNIVKLNIKVLQLNLSQQTKSICEPTTQSHLMKQKPWNTDGGATEIYVSYSCFINWSSYAIIAEGRVCLIMHAQLFHIYFKAHFRSGPSNKKNTKEWKTWP